MTVYPETLATRPFFSSGPTAKHPEWSPEALHAAPVRRSHRTSVAKDHIRQALEKTKAILRVPDRYRVAIVPAPDSPTVEMALWSLLGPLPAEIADLKTSAMAWTEDLVEKLRLDAWLHRAAYGHLPNLNRVDAATSDVVFTWNGAASDVRIPNIDRTPAIRAGLTICDATSVEFAPPLPFARSNVTVISWQETLGGGGAPGELILSPCVGEHLEQHGSDWSSPRLFRLIHNGELNERVFVGTTINTPRCCVTRAIWTRCVGLSASQGTQL